MTTSFENEMILSNDTENITMNVERQPIQKDNNLIKIYVINLKHKTQLRKEMIEKLSKFSIEITLVSLEINFPIFLN